MTEEVSLVPGVMNVYFGALIELINVVGGQLLMVIVSQGGDLHARR